MNTHWLLRPWHIIILVSLLFISTIKCEVFTAFEDLKDILKAENLLLQTVENYIRSEEQRLDLLKQYVGLYKEKHNEASEDVEKYLANPINAYVVVKRLTSEWKQVEALINTNYHTDYMANITHIKETMKFPTDEDLNGVAVALTRLQDTYRLDTASLAKGRINGVKYTQELTAADCFELGKQSYQNKDYYHTQLWMTEADNRLKREINQTVEESDILEYLAFSTYKQGNLPLALDLTNKLLEIIPDHSRALGNKVYYEDELKNVKEEKRKGDDGTEQVAQDSEIKIAAQISEERQNYEKLCRGELALPVEISSKLKCRYVHRNDSFLLIAPFKVEEAHHDPDIFIYHGVLSDAEIETLKQLALPRFRRATVQNYETGELETANYRISKSAWLKEVDHEHVADVCQRVADITGLTMSTAEELQVVNYGIGGHYEPHYDFARKDEANAFKSLGTGNRIATVLFYMSDVDQGGATVFPHLDLALWPEKGAAAFWFNLHPSGDGDADTRHAACPVLVGSKWVCNKWIHERGQEFLRPCTQERPDPDRIA